MDTWTQKIPKTIDFNLFLMVFEVYGNGFERNIWTKIMARVRHAKIFGHGKRRKILFLHNAFI